MRQDAEVIMKLTDADNAADGIFFPALEQNMMGAVLINENDEVMFFNPAAEKLWGYKREEVIGNNIDMLIPRDLRPAHPQYIRHNREGGKARVEGMSRELQLEKKDGSKICKLTKKDPGLIAGISLSVFLSLALFISYLHYTHCSIRFIALSIVTFFQYCRH